MNKCRFTNNGVERSCMSSAENSRIVSQSEILSLAHTDLLVHTGGEQKPCLITKWTYAEILNVLIQI